MRRQSVPAGLRLTIILLYAVNLKTALSEHVLADHTTEQEHLVCKKSDSHHCVTWHLGPGADPDIIIEESPSNATKFCGLSDLKRIVPHRKFITVKSLEKDGKSKIVFCKAFTKLRGNIINWKQIEKALNALSRTRRQTTFYPKGRYRGQTQSQYLAIDRGNGKDEGKAEAHSAADSSRASVSGNSGMGQAQSQSIFDPSCDDCYGKSDVASLKRGPYVPEVGGNKNAYENGYVPSGSYGSGKDGSPIVDGSNGYRPGQGINNGLFHPNNGQGPVGNGAFGPEYPLTGTPGEYGGYGPSGLQGGSGGSGPSGLQGGSGGSGPSGLQGGSGGSGPDHINRPGATGYGPTSGMTPVGSQGGNGGYRPGDQQRGIGGYGPGQGTSPGGSSFGPTLVSSPGSSQPGSGSYSQKVGPGSVGFSSFPGSTPSGSLGGSSSFGPGGQQGGSGGYGPAGQQDGNRGYRPGGQQAGNGGFRPGDQHGGDGSYGPGGQQSGSTGYIPGSQQGQNGGYGPGGQQGISGGYSPGQTGGPGTTGFGPSSTTTLGGSPGGNGQNKPGLGGGPGSLGYGPTSGQEDRPHTGSGPGQNGGNGFNYINRPGDNTFSPSQGLLPTGVRGNTPGQNGATNLSFGPQQTSRPGENGLLGNSGNDINQRRNIGYPINQGQTHGDFGPNNNIRLGENGQVQPGVNSGVANNYPASNVPGQGNKLYGPGQPGSGTVENKLTGTNWPLALGPFPGPPGSSVYCCVVPNNYGQNTGVGGNVLPSTGTGYPYYGPGQGGPTITGGSAPSNLYDRTYGSNVPGINDMRIPQTYDKGGPLNQLPYGTSNIYDPTSSYGKRPGVSGSFGSGVPGGPGGPNSNVGTGSPGGPVNQNGVLGSTGPGGQNGLQGPNNFGTSFTGEPGGQNGILETGNNGRGGQIGMQGPGNFGTGGPSGQNGFLGTNTYRPITNGGTGGHNVMQGPAPSDTGTMGLGPPNGVQGPGVYSPSIYGDSGFRQPGVNGGPGNNFFIPGGARGQPGNQNAMQTPGVFGTDATGMAPGQNGKQGPMYGIGTPGGVIQSGVAGPELYNTGSPGELGQNSLQGPGIYNSGSPGGLGQNGLQGSGIYNTGSPGGLGQNGLQGPGIQGQNGLPGAGPARGTYDTSAGPGIGMPGPGGVNIGTSPIPAGQNGPQGSAVYGTDLPNEGGSYGTGNNQNIPNNQIGRNPNTGSSGPGAYNGQNGNIIPGTVHSGDYPGGTQYPPNSRGPDDQTFKEGNTDLYRNQPQGSLNINPSSIQHGISSQGNILQGTKYNGIPQNFIDPNSVAMDGDDSEAEATVNQAANGTTASASSKGGNDKGRAQTHVHGTYTGGGSFQAQAQITGENKEAASEVNGGKKGASSSATGSGRNNKSQASVQLGSETGSIQTQSQSNGAMHSSNSQVQGSVKGGMADAQAKGPGSTSSQAQIGFTPYNEGDKAHELLQTPFTGGGVASAQSSGRIGQSQTQLHGTFKYGITYNGAAQSGASLDKDAVFPNRLNFEKIDVFDEKQKNINVTENLQPEILPTESTILSEVPLETKTQHNINNEEVTTEKANEETMKKSESRYSSHTHLDHHKTNIIPAPLPTTVGSRRSFQPGYEKTSTDYEYTTDKDEIPPEEYDTDPGYGGEPNDATDAEQNAGEEFPNYEEYSRDYETHQSIQNPRRKGLQVQQSTGGNTQHIVLGPLNNHDAEIIQKNSEKPDESKIYQPGERVPGIRNYRIPIGFTGSVKSVASKENTYVVGSKHSPSQAQTVTLTPGTGKINYMYPPSHGKYVNPNDLRSLQSQNPKDDRYVSVSKSVTRALDAENNIRKQYSHTYYTKSSSCGYFTFTCTMVSGVDGRKKVCKPKIPTNPDGTPIRC